MSTTAVKVNHFNITDIDGLRDLFDHPRAILDGRPAKPVIVTLKDPNLRGRDAYTKASIVATGLVWRGTTIVRVQGSATIDDQRVAFTAEVDPHRFSGSFTIVG